jgi:hypothetical protein
MIRRALPALLLVVSFLVPQSAHATTSTGVSISSVSDGVRLTLTLPRRVYPRNALVRATLRIQNVGHHTILTRFGDGCAITNPFIEVFDGRGRLMDQGPLIVSGNPGCPTILGQPFLPGRTVRQHVFAVLRGRYVRAVLNVGKSLNGRLITPKLAVRLVHGKAPIVTIKQSKIGPFAQVDRPPGASGPLYFVGSARCGSASNFQGYSSTPLWSRAAIAEGNRVYSGCYGEQQWRALAGYLNFPVATIDYTAPKG